MGLSEYLGKFCPGKAGSLHYKRERSGLSRMKLFACNRKIYEEFITLPGQNGTEFHPGQPRSYNHHLRIKPIMTYSIRTSTASHWLYCMKMMLTLWSNLLFFSSLFFSLIENQADSLCIHLIATFKM